MKKFPAQQAAYSRLLVSKATNATQMQLDRERDLIFDPISTTEHIPWPTLRHPCNPETNRIQAKEPLFK